MALTDGAVLVPGVGHILLATVGATAPVLADLTAFAADTTDLPTGFTNLGHTSLDDVLVFDQDGGDTEVKGSWQNPSLRTVITSTAVDFFTIKALQAQDNTVLSLYYGGGDATGADQFELPDSPAATEKAALIIMLDGSTPVGFYCPKVSILRADAPEVSADGFMTFPLKFTVLKYSSEPRAVWISTLLGV